VLVSAVFITSCYEFLFFPLPAISLVEANIRGNFVLFNEVLRPLGPSEVAFYLDYELSDYTSFF
jgi:hypothetical protein